MEDRSGKRDTTVENTRLTLVCPYEVLLLFINVTGSGFGIEDDEESTVPCVCANFGVQAARREPVDRSAAFTERLNESMGAGDELCGCLYLRFRI